MPAKNVTKTVAALNEDATTSPRIDFYLRPTDENGDPLTGNDRWYTRVILAVSVGGDDSGERRESVPAIQLVNSPILTTQEKLDLKALLVKIYDAARNIQGYD